MRLRRTFALGLWLTALACAIGAVRLTRVPIDTRRADATGVPPAASTESTPDPTLLTESIAALRGRNPFRLARSPTSQAYGALETSAAAPTPVSDRTALPPLRIGGIVGGPPWSVVVEGVPGHEAGLLIRTGEQLNGVRVLWVRDDSVGLSAGDSTWVLMLKGLEH